MWRAFCAAFEEVPACRQRRRSTLNKQNAGTNHSWSPEKCRTFFFRGARAGNTTTFFQSSTDCSKRSPKHQLSRNSNLVATVCLDKNHGVPHPLQGHPPEGRGFLISSNRRASAVLRSPAQNGASFSGTGAVAVSLSDHLQRM